MLRAERNPLSRFRWGVWGAICAAMLVGPHAAAQSGALGPFSGTQFGRPGESEAKRPFRPPSFGPVEQTPLVEVRIVGNQVTPEARIRSMLQTRVGRVYDSEQVQADVRSLISSGLFRDVKTYHQRDERGVTITFELIERPLAQYVRFVGNEKVKDKVLAKEVQMKAGDPLNQFAVDEARRRLEQLYRERGFSDTHITVLEGEKPGDRGVVFQINEGRVIRILRTVFEGNTIASDARLRTQIKSKPGVLWMLGGKANTEEIDQDLDRLTAYYRSLGFFQARVGRRLEFIDERTWLSITFAIDEGTRYRIRDILLDGNEKFTAGQLAAKMKSQAGEYFNLARMQLDLQTLRDEYGSQGYIFADINAEPRFHEEPGWLDIVYRIEEGEQYRVGRILVNIEGDYSHTRRNVVLNRLSIRPGDVVDVRELRASERRLQASELFLHDPAQGITPRIVVKPPEQNGSRIADAEEGAARGQSPQRPHVSFRPIVDVLVRVRTHQGGPNR
jgi:outer membrane protein insertion porin family